MFVGYSWSGRAGHAGCWVEHTIVDRPYACPAANIKGPTDALERGEARPSIEGEPHDMVLEVQAFHLLLPRRLVRARQVGGQQ